MFAPPLTYKFERLVRCMEGWSSFRAFLNKHGCKLISASEDLCDRLPSGRLRNNLLVAVAEYERLNTAEKVRTKMMEQVKRGIWNCGQVPFGYDYDRQTKMLFPNAEEAPVVTRIYEQAARLIPAAEIARKLAADGAKTRMRIFKHRDGNVRAVGARSFRPDALRRLIASPIYAGRLRFKGQEFRGNHLPIVELDLWERANAALARPVLPKHRTHRQQNKHAHLLKGMVHCQSCSRPLVPVLAGRRPDGRRYRYYVCDDARNATAGTRCETGYVQAAALESAVLQIIEQCSSHPKILSAAVSQSQVRANSDTAIWRAELAEINNKLAEIERRTANCVGAIALDGLEALKEELQARVMVLALEKQQGLVKRERLAQLLRAEDLDLAKVEEVCAGWRQLCGDLPTATPAEWCERIRYVLERVDLKALSRDEKNNGARSLELKVKLRVPASADFPHMPEPAPGPCREDRPTRPVAAMVVVSSFGSSDQVLTFFSGRTQIFTSRAKGNSSPEEIQQLHPLHRALKWGKRLRSEPALKRIVLAREEKVCPATITHHLRLLQLAPEIQTRLLGITTRSDLEKYSLNKMKALAALPVHEQLIQFGKN